MVKTRRRNYNNVTFDDEDDVRDISSNASEDSGGSEANDDVAPPGKDTDSPDSAPPLKSPPPPPPQAKEGEEEKDPECTDLLPPILSPISRMFQRLVDLDVAATQALAVSATPASPLGSLRPLFRLLEFSCHGVPWLIIAVTLLLIGSESSLVRHAHLLVLLLVDLVIVGVSKAIFRRQRPAVNIADDVLTVSVDKYAFPSGHATRASLLLLYLCVEYFSSASSSLCSSLVVAWATSVVMSRVIIGRHHVLDVMAGCVIGGLIFGRLSPLLVTPVSTPIAQFVAASLNQRQWVLAHVPECLAEYL